MLEFSGETPVWFRGGIALDPVEPRVPYPPNADIGAVDAQLAAVAKRWQLVGDDVIMPSTTYIDQ